MSSPTYRSRGEANNYRGNYNRGGFQPRGQFRGRGGYKPRRYWDNDDYYKRDRDYDRGRDRDRRRRSRSDSRSRSRSNSRSYSRSRSQSPTRTRSPRKSEEYKPKTATDPVLISPGPTVTYQPQTAQYDPYNPQKDAKEGSWSGVVDPNLYVPQPQRTNGQPQAVNNSNPYGASSDAIQLQLQQFQKYQQQLQQQRSQPNFPTEMNVTSSSTNSVGNLYSFGSNAMAYQQQATIAYPNQQVQQHQAGELNLDVSIGQIKPKREEGETEKSKKKKDRKKKKRRRRSSSSSSSSSDDSSDSRTKRKSKRDSDDSSDSSSDEDKKKKEKENTGSLTTEQKEALLKQKEGYNMKLEILDREINRLIIQGDELRNSKADIRLAEENFNLQAELKGRRKAVQIVMGKIGDVLNRAMQGSRSSHPVPPPPPKISQASPPGYVPHVPQVKKEDGLSNVEYYDNGIHWCRICNVFPETVVDLLNHCHSKEHQSQLQLMNISERPWQKKTDKKEIKVAPGAKRIPFRGVQFLSPVVGWYCRICSAWIGDHECAEQHFKSEEHNSAYLNFLAEHPDWETKWLTDRAKLLGTVTPDKNKRTKSRFDVESDSAALEEDGKSFRVHMRNTVKADENRTSAEISVKADTTSKDVSVEEWMSKPQKVKLDIIDTQKFAAIVRQKHGQKEKDELAKAMQHQQNKSFPSSAPQFNQRDSEPSKRDDYGPRDRRPSDANRRYERVEMQFSGSRDRDRYGGGLHRGARRRSRSRSRSRSRDRDRDRYNNRRRSRERSRDRSQRSRDRSRSRSRGGERERDKDKPDVKEQIRRLPMIGKMPLYKKPTATSSSMGKEKEKISEYGTEITSTDKATEKVLQKITLDSKTSGNVGQHLHQQEESNMSEPSENSMTGFGVNYNPSAGFNEDGFSGSNLSATAFSLDASNASGDEPTSLPVNTLFQPPSFDSKPIHVEKDLKPPGEKEPLAAGTGLPDDLQQALDIIYSGGGKPITVPPPSIPTGVPPPATNFGMTDFSAPNPSGYGNYMGYQPYQHSFDGYGPASGYEELDDGPPGVTAASTSTSNSQTPAEEPPQKPEIQPEPSKDAPLDDDMEDLRMLGIDVDDVAVGGIR